MIDSFIDKSDPGLEKTKPITVKEAQELTTSLKEVRRTAGNDLSPELNQLITGLERALSLTREGERGLAEVNIEGINEQGGAAILAIRNAIDGELEPHRQINQQMARVILGIDRYVGDKMNAKLRHDNLIAELTNQLKEGGIEVEDGASLSDLSGKFSTTTLSLPTLL